MKYFLIGWVFAHVVLTATAEEVDCQKGFSAFQETVFPKIQKDCKQCHGGANVKAPPFAVEDQKRSYFHVLNYVDFGTVDNSVLTDRAGNGHCLQANCDETSGREMRALLSAWWEKGEKECQRSGKFFTEELPLPKVLPAGPKDFAPVKWDLGTVSLDLKGVAFQLDMQQFVKPTKDHPGAYRFRRPRFVGGKKGINVKGIRLLVNRKLDPTANSFINVDQIVGPAWMSTDGNQSIYPVLSNRTLIAMQVTEADDKISISYEGLGVAEPKKCVAVKAFEDLVLPIIKSENCFKCHAGNNGEPGTVPANEVFPMRGDNAALCDASRQRVQWKDTIQSPFISFGFGRVPGHPAITVNTDEKFKAVLEWMEKEKL